MQNGNSEKVKICVHLSRNWNLTAGPARGLGGLVSPPKARFPDRASPLAQGLWDVNPRQGPAQYFFLLTASSLRAEL